MYVDHLIEIIIVMFGLIIGSFINVLIYRLPLGINIVFPGSACPLCKNAIYWFHNIPLLGFILQLGKCYHCQEKISYQYPIVEFICGLMAFLLIPDYLETLSIVRFVFLFSIFVVFLAHFVIDVQHKILPNGLNLYLGLLFLSWSVVYEPWDHWLIGAAVGFGFPLFIAWAFYMIKGQIGLGGGDIKLYGVLGIYLGWKVIIQTIFLSSFLGAIIGLGFILSGKMDRKDTIPFGPFILIVASIQIFLPLPYFHFMKILIP